MAEGRHCSVTGWTSAEDDGCGLYRPARRGSRLTLRALRCGPACAGRASPRLSPALTPGQRRRRRRLDLTTAQLGNGSANPRQRITRGTRVRCPAATCTNSRADSAACSEATGISRPLVPRSVPRRPYPLGLPAGKPILRSGRWPVASWSVGRVLCISTLDQA